MGYYNQSEEELWRMVTFLFPAVRRSNSMWVVGAHRFDEYGSLSWLFPQIDDLVLFEPIPSLAEELRHKFKNIPWVKVIEKALYSRDGVASMILTSNDMASSSLKAMVDHKVLFPKIKEVGSTTVQVRTVPTILEEENLNLPKVLILDTQGSEGDILATCSDKLLKDVLLIYTEASLTEVYEENRTLPYIATSLFPTHYLIAYSPITPDVPEHGNAVFVNKQVY